MPKSYEEYCAALQRSFGTSRNNFLEEQDICSLLDKNVFQILDMTYTPGYLAGTYLSWRQFILYLRAGNTVSQQNFVSNFLFWSLMRPFERKSYPGGILCVAKKLSPKKI